MDETGTTLLRDPYQWPLAHSESGRDKALKLYSSLVLRRENFAGRVSAERSMAVPGMRSGWLQYTRADGVYPVYSLHSHEFCSTSFVNESSVVGASSGAFGRVFIAGVPDTAQLVLGTRLKGL